MNSPSIGWRYTDAKAETEAFFKGVHGQSSALGRLKSRRLTFSLYREERDGSGVIIAAEQRLNNLSSAAPTTPAAMDFWCLMGVIRITFSFARLYGNCIPDQGAPHPQLVFQEHRPGYYPGNKLIVSPVLFQRLGAKSSLGVRHSLR